MSEQATTEGARRPVTWAEFVALPEDDLRELIDGELVEVEVPGHLHEAIVADLAYYLGGWVREHGAGRVLGSGYKVRISETRGVMPDLQVLSKETWQRTEDAGLASGRPEVAVELISPSSRRYDRVIKLRYYADAGVPEYWIVDPEARTVERLVLRDGAYVIAQTAGGEETFQPEGWDGLAIPLAELWGRD
jgi:Uma2 family endonuclease